MAKLITEDELSRLEELREYAQKYMPECIIGKQHKLNKAMDKIVISKETETLLRMYHNFQAFNNEVCSASCTLYEDEVDKAVKPLIIAAASYEKEMMNIVRDSIASHLGLCRIDSEVLEI